MNNVGRNRLSVWRILVSPLVALVVSTLVLAPVPVSAYGEEESAPIELQAYEGFVDVNSDDWYVRTGMLDYVVDNGLLTGYDNEHFGPWDDISRGQMAVILHRMAGSPEADGTTFDDVDYARYYGPAISWARSSGVVTGYTGSNNFGPDNSITREEFATMLANYASKIGDTDVASNCKALDAIPGSSDVSLWARENMGWAVDSGLLSGVEQVDGSKRVEPQGHTQRCQAAKMITVLHRDVLDAAGDNPDWIPSGITLASSVETVNKESYRATGNLSAVVSAGEAADIQVGDVVVLEPSDAFHEGASIKVANKSVLANGVAISGTEPEFSEIFVDFDVSGTTDGLISFEPAPGVTVIEDISTQVAVANEHQLVDKTFKIGSYGTLKLDASVNYDIDWGFFAGFRKLNLGVDSGAHFDWEAAAEFDRSFRVGRATFAGNDDILGISVDFYVTVSASGSVHVWADAVAGVDLTLNGNKLDVTSYKDFDYGTSLSGEVRAGVEPAVVLSAFNADLIDVTLGFGGVIDGELVPRSADFVCCDLSAWMYINFGIGQQDNLANALGVSGNWEILNKSNSPRWDGHADNGKMVDRCTWKEYEQPDEPDTPDQPDDSEQPDEPEWPDQPDNPSGSDEDSDQSGAFPSSGKPGVDGNSSWEDYIAPQDSKLGGVIPGSSRYFYFHVNDVGDVSAANMVADIWISAPSNENDDNSDNKTILFDEFWVNDNVTEYSGTALDWDTLQEVTFTMKFRFTPDSLVITVTRSGEDLDDLPKAFTYTAKKSDYK